MTPSSSRAKPVYYQLEHSTLLIDSWNSRLKILGFGQINEVLLEQAAKLAAKLGLGKIIALVPDEKADLMSPAGFVFEGEIPAYLNGARVWCCSRFLDEERARNPLQVEEDHIVTELLGKERRAPRALPPGCEIRPAREEDLPQMIELFSGAFSTYPSEITNPVYLRSHMGSQGGIYHLAVEGSRIAGIASAEIDGAHLNAELTDCVTRPECRGQGILQHLLASLEEELASRGISCAYSLSRAHHPPINHSFYARGFDYCGRMVNNCQMCGSFEDMNIWVKPLPNNPSC